MAVSIQIAKLKVRRYQWIAISPNFIAQKRKLRATLYNFVPILRAACRAKRAALPEQKISSLVTIHTPQFYQVWRSRATEQYSVCHDIIF
jgi:hypothetical protein